MEEENGSQHLNTTMLMKFKAMLAEIARRPAMYVGRPSLRAVSHHLDGYAHAMQDAGCAECPLDGWQRWVEMRFLISHPAWNWTRILVHVYGGDMEAFATLPLLYEEFCNQRMKIGVAGIEAECRRVLMAEYGQDWHEPEITKTPQPWLADVE